MFSLVMLYWALFFFVFALLLTVPELVAGYRSLPAGKGPLSPDELAQARDIARHALEGRLLYAVAAATVTVGLALWAGVLPGLRGRRPR